MLHSLQQNPLFIYWNAFCCCSIISDIKIRLPHSFGIVSITLCLNSCDRSPAADSSYATAHWTDPHERCGDS